MTGNFSKRRSVFSVKVKVGVHIIPAFTQFKYLRYIVQNVGEIEGDVKHQIQTGWLRWRSVLGVLSDAKITLKLEEIFIRQQ